MRWHVLDANSRTSRAWDGVTASVVGQWLAWEIDRSPATLTGAATADGVFLACSDSLDWSAACRPALRAVGIEPDARRRGRHGPLVVAGGPVDASPAAALKVADILAVGEAYRLVRALLAAATPAAALAAAEASPHALTRRQFDPDDRDPRRPWLMRAAAGPLAEPDRWIDWSAPDVRSDDGVIRIIASKGCKLKCAFCATTYRQPPARSPTDRLLRRTAAHAGDRVQLLSNDPLNTPGFRAVRSRLDHASLTVMELRDPENLAAVIRSRPKIVRVGVEGVSPRIRQAFGKPISDDELLARLAALHRARIHTHTFWIAGAPFETAADWAEWWQFWDRFSAAVDWGMHRAKLTAFAPTPPAPLARWLPPSQAAGTPTRADILARRAASPHLRRVLIVAGGRSGLWRRRCAGQFGATDQQMPWHPERTTDLAPTPDEWDRLPAEAIRWPIPGRRRHAQAALYRSRLAAP